MEPLPQRRKEGGGEIVEVYGFAGWIASFVAYAIYLVWAFVPESMLHAVGVTYYPSKYWAIAIPCAIFVTASSVVLAYMAVNFLSTAPLDSFDTITELVWMQKRLTHHKQAEICPCRFAPRKQSQRKSRYRAVLPEEGDRARRRLADLAKLCDSTPVFSGHDS